MVVLSDGLTNMSYRTVHTQNIKLVIFDLDGTLVDAYQAIVSSFNYTMNSLHYPKRSARVIRRAVGWGDRNLLKPFVHQRDVDSALSIYRKHHANALLSGTRLFPGVRKVLSNLRNKGYALAVASNRPTRFSRILIRHLKLKQYFDYVLCADALAHMKPHPEIINRIMQRFSVKPAQAAYVGDMIIDVQAGRRANVMTIAVITGSHTRTEIQRVANPDLIIRGIKDLLMIL